MTMPAWADNDDHWRGRHEDRRDYRNDARERWEERRQHEWRRAAEERHQIELRRAAERREAERRHEWERRRDLERHRAAAAWRFERDRGWRFEHRPGYWSPHFVWWMIGGQPVLRPFPTTRVVRYQTGYYELLGDGISVPYHWVWRPTMMIATPPPPVPLAPPVPNDYPFPPGGYFPPPPQG